MELVTHKPSNGPEIVVLQNPEAFTASFGWFVKTGARHEEQEVAGVSHFLEHMVFKGTDRRSAEDVNRELDHLGAHSNAYTSEDSTVYYASVLPECQAEAVDLLTDLMRPRLLEEDFEMEKQVILEEIAMYDDQPPYGAFEAAAETFFGEHPLATRVLGTTETVADLTVEQMRKYHGSRYTADNMVLVGSGNVDVTQLVDQATALFDTWPAAQASEVVSPPPRFHHGDVVIEREQIHQHYLVKFWPGVDCNDPDRYALRMLCSILADDSCSRLFWELIDTGKAESASLFPQLFDDCGCLIGYICGAPEEAESNEAAMDQVLQQAIAATIQQTELELAYNKIRSALILSDERPGNRLFAVGQSWLNRRNYEPLDVVLGKYRDVTVADIQRVASRTLENDPVAVRVVSS